MDRESGSSGQCHDAFVSDVIQIATSWLKLKIVSPEVSRIM